MPRKAAVEKQVEPLVQLEKLSFYEFVQLLSQKEKNDQEQEVAFEIPNAS